VAGEAEERGGNPRMRGGILGGAAQPAAVVTGGGVVVALVGFGAVS
jgi:hypothetical protein